MSTASNHLVIFTPRALIVDNGAPPPSNDLSEAFSQWLAGRAQSELRLFSVATKSVGGSDLDATFDNFVQALELADCAIIVFPGQQVCLLDVIYPRLLVHLTMRPWWLERMLLVSLGEIAKNGKKFDPMLLSHPPVIFSTSPITWEHELKQWEEVVDFIHPNSSSEQTAAQHSGTKEKVDLGSSEQGSLLDPQSAEELDGEIEEQKSPRDLQATEVLQENQTGTSPKNGLLSKGERRSSVVNAEDYSQCESETDARIYEEPEISMEEPCKKKSLTWRKMGAAATSVLLIAAVYSFLKARLNS